jgi:hypothetical protein
MIDQNCQVYFSDDAQSDAPSTGSPTLIINGRVTVRGIVECNKPGTDNISDNPAYFLCGSNDRTDIYLKFCMNSGTQNGTFGPAEFDCGGNGVLFSNGVYLARDPNAPDGSASVEATVSLLVFFTGGALA